MSPVVDFDPARRTNAQAIADMARLGILRPDDHVLDMTVGPERGFWKEWTPGKLTTNDIDRSVKARHHWDALGMPVDDRSFDVTVFDPPYANRGTATREIDDRYGTTEYRSPRDVERLLTVGAVEALRVCDRLALVKCQDACVASRYRPQSFLVWEAATKAGARLVAELYVVGRREQPKGKVQKNVWSSCSTLMVFERGK
jgi:hypothetical protein